MSSETLVKLGGTQNKAWAESANKSYGMKMMKMMGWKEGDGLGKEGEGQVTHIQMKRRPENLGLGNTENDPTSQISISTIGEFSEVLSYLKQSNSGIVEKMKKKEEKNKKKEEKKKEKEAKKQASKKSKKSRKSKKPIHKYSKILANKAVKNYSSDDLNAILGISPREDDTI